jgi:RHS repeat-associated protein
MNPFRICWLSVLLFIALGRVHAADKSGVGPNSISVPKGPGSIEGMGEAFQPTLNTGTAKHAISFGVPAGTAGQTPSLGLAYEGGSGNGPVGFGWRMTVPFVQRQTEKGIPRYVDASNGIDDNRDGVVDDPAELDRFINEAKEELVGLAGGDFFVENEGSFIRYRRRGGGWEGTRPDGSVMVFGSGSPARVHDGAGRVFAWLLESITDTRGNTVRFQYTGAAGDANLHQKYLQRIEYGAGSGSWSSFHFVQFEYEVRPDWFEDCRPGFPVRTGQRLKRVLVCTQGIPLAGHQAGDRNGDGQADFLDRRYELAYLDYAGAATHWSYLSSVTQFGADNVSSLPSARYGYSVCHPPAALSATGRVTGSENTPFAVMDNPLVDFVDLNGDGLPDILKTSSGGGAHQVSYNLGEHPIDGSTTIRWSGPAEVSSEDGMAWGINLRSGGAPGEAVAHLADMDADGTADLVFHSPGNDVYFFANRHRAGWGVRQFMASDGQVPSPFGDASTKSADMDFDKRMDVVQSIATGGGADYRIWYNLGGQRFSEPVTVPQDEGMQLADKAVSMADWNGDRLLDMVRIRPATLEINAAWGHGRFSPQRIIAIPDGPLTPEQVASASMRDITGDGLADLVVEKAEPGVLWYWINLGTDRFAPRRSIIGLPSGGFGAVVRWADLNGNTTTDYIVASSTWDPPIQSVDLGTLMGCVSASSLMTRIENGIGRVTTLEYATSTQFALADAAAGQPWDGPVPFPVSVVSRVLTSDSLGHTYETRYRYHDGFYDGVEQEFRGFGRVEVIEVGDASALTLVTTSHFDTGRTHKAMKGRLRRLVTAEDSGAVFTDETTDWDTPPRLLHRGTDGREVRYAAPTRKRTRILEKGQGTERTTLSEMVFDEHGNQTVQRDFGIVEGDNRNAFNDERFTTTVYAKNLTAWILRPVAQTEVSDEDGTVISRSRLFYDDESFSGGNFQQVSVGNLTLRRDWIDPGAGTFIEAVRNRYDAYGNIREILDPLADGTDAAGHLRRLAWDATFHGYPETETIVLGGGKAPLSYRAEYDRGFGVVTAAVDFNGNRTTFGYDAFARLTGIVKPGDTAAFPTAEYSYHLAVPTGSGGVVNFVESRSLDRDAGTAGAKSEHYLISRDFVDGMGRKLMTKTEAEPASGGGAARVAVSGAVRFSARAKPAEALNPFFSSAGMAFENIEAAGWTGTFSQNGALVQLGLAGAHRTRTAYDATLREAAITNADGTTRRTAYEPLLTRSFDENDNDPGSPHAGTPMVHANDGLGRLVLVDEVTRLNDDGTPAGAIRSWITRYEYDLNDQLTKITDSQNNVKLMAYDGLKRKTFLNDPDRGVMHFVFDAASNLMESTDAKGQRISYTYDGANRILTEDYHDEGRSFSAGFRFNPQQPVSPANRPDVAYFYDEPVPGLDIGDGTAGTAANTKGKLAYVWDLSGEEHTSYDARDRVAWVVKRIRDPLHRQLVSWRTGFAYDSLDRLTALVYPDNDAIGYHYNERSLLARIAGGPSGSIISRLAYEASGQQAEIAYGNGVRTAYAYDSRLRLKDLHTRRWSEAAAEPTPLIHFGYQFDPVSNITAITDQRPGSAVPAGDKRRNTQIFQYDDLYRLTRVQYSFALPGSAPADDGQVSYRYDRIGNMLAQTSSMPDTDPHTGLPVANLGAMESGGSAGRWNRTGRAPADPPGPHALSSIANPAAPVPVRQYPYDANGNMTSLDGMTATWDFKDRLVALEDATMRAEYVYDFTDRRITKRVTKKPSPAGLLQPRVTWPFTTIYVGKHFEVREFDAPTKFVFNGDTRIARVTGSLSPNQRVQRLRVSAGWNLVSIAVHALQGAAQLAATGHVEMMRKWDPATRTFVSVAPADLLPAGTILWIKAATAGTLRVTGIYPGPTPNLRAPPEGTFLPARGLESWPVYGALDRQAATTLWRFDPERQAWQTKLPETILKFSDLPPAFAPHDAIFAQSPLPLDLETPDPASAVRFYHQDHLGSSSNLTNTKGALINESSYYPYGSLRFRSPELSRSDSYQFTQKERDTESELDYFDARYFGSRLPRFISTDPIIECSFEKLSPNPQRWNAYAYCRSNPIAFVDVDGKEEWKITLRAYIPENSFSFLGTQNMGDGRGFSMESGASSRAAVTFTLETDPKSSLVPLIKAENIQTYSSGSTMSFCAAGNCVESKGTAEVDVRIHENFRTEEGTGILGISFSASDPAVPIASRLGAVPSTGGELLFQVSPAGDLVVTGNVRTYPSFEAYAEKDGRKQKIFDLPVEEKNNSPMSLVPGFRSWTAVAESIKLEENQN